MNQSTIIQSRKVKCLSNNKSWITAYRKELLNEKSFQEWGQRGAEENADGAEGEAEGEQGGVREDVRQQAQAK